MTEVVQYTPQQELVAQVRSEQFRSEVALALPENVTPERFVRVAITALQANPDIADLERQSVYRSLLQSAAMGLLPDGREAAVVGFKGKAQLIPMIGGFRKLAAEYGWTIYTSIVFANDEFRYEQGLDIVFKHVPVRPGADRGEPIAAYAVGKHADGRRELEVLTVAEIEKVRAVSRAKDSGPWVGWWEQMAEKTAGRRLFKKLPLSDDDKRVRLISATVEPGEAAAALYGDVDRATGEILPASVGARQTGGALPASPDPQQAAEAASPVSDETARSEPSPSASAVPEVDDDEPSLGEAETTSEADQLVELGALKPPTGENKDKTLDEIAALGEKGWKWLSWACEDKRPWFRDGHPHAEFGVAVREYVALRSKEQS